jgi:methionyl aminopeptidase
MRGAKVKINTPDEIAMSRAAGKLAAAVLDMITPHVKPGVSTEELDKLCHDYIVDELRRFLPISAITVSQKRFVLR